MRFCVSYQWLLSNRKSDANGLSVFDTMGYQVVTGHSLDDTRRPPRTRHAPSPVQARARQPYVRPFYPFDGYL